MKITLILLATLLLAACSRAPAQSLTASSPADPEVRVPPTRYSSTLGTYVSQRPVDPAPWKEQNERVAPRSKE
jgi:hypothetical protein